MYSYDNIIVNIINFIKVVKNIRKMSTIVYKSQEMLHITAYIIKVNTKTNITYVR